MADTPDGKEYREPQAVVGVEWEKLAPIRRIVRQLDNGDFGDASRLADYVTRDARIRGCLGARVGAIVGTPLDFEPAKIRGRETAKTRSIAEQVRTLWPRMFPATQIARLLKWGHLVAAAPGELVWDTGEDLWIPHLKVWHPQFLNWDWSLRRYVLSTYGRLDKEVSDPDDYRVALPRIDRDIHSDGHWVLWTPHGYEYGWMEGLIRSLAELYLFRRWSQRDHARFNEVHGLPIRKVKTPMGGDIKERDRVLRRLERLGTETTVETPQDAQGYGYDVTLVEATARGWETFGGSLDRIDADIGAVILGAGTSGPKVASLSEDGRASQDEAVRGDLKAADAEIAGCLQRQALWWFCQYNYGDGSLAPTPVYQLDPPDDEERRTRIYTNLANALQPLAQHGVDTDQLLEDEGLPMLPEAEREPEVPPAEPGPTGSPDGTGAQLTTLAAAPRRARPRTYAGRVAARAAAHAVAPLGDNVKAILADVKAATSPEDLKRRLLARAGDLDEKQLAEFTRKAILVAELAGRWEVVKGL